MRRSLGDKRRLIPPDKAADVLQLLAGFEDGATRPVVEDGTEEDVVVSRISATTQFGYRKITVERPLRARSASRASTSRGASKTWPSRRSETGRSVRGRSRGPGSAECHRGHAANDAGHPAPGPVGVLGRACRRGPAGRDQAAGGGQESARDSSSRSRVACGVCRKRGFHLSPLPAASGYTQPCLCPFGPAPTSSLATSFAALAGEWYLASALWLVELSRGIQIGHHDEDRFQYRRGTRS